METRTEQTKSRFQIVKLEERIAPSGLLGLVKVDLDVDVDIDLKFGGKGGCYDPCHNPCRPSPCYNPCR